MSPTACVGCHVSLPELDARLSTAMQQWMQGVEPKLLAKAQGAAPAGVVLTGMHPEAAEALADVPAACMSCHTPDSGEAPDFGRMIHVIHLTGGDENHFMTLFQGECTHCHKLDAATGRWTVPSAGEK